MSKRVIKFFKGDHWFLDNSYQADITHTAVTYPTLTHAFLGAETDDLILKVKIAESSLAELSGIADGMPTPYSGFQGPRVMRELLERKFGVKTVADRMTLDQGWLSKKLIATGDHDLVYGNHSCNVFYGSCECPQHYGKPGKNVLGGLLMGVRARLIDSMVRYYDLNTTCSCLNKCEAFFMYSLDGKNWLKPFCDDCEPTAGLVAKHCADDDLVLRFERSWAEKEAPKEPVNKIKVHQTIVPEFLRHTSWDEDDDMPWVGPRIPTAPPEPKFQSKVIYLSGRIK